MRVCSQRGTTSARLGVIAFHLFWPNADPEALACWILLSGEALREPKLRVRFEKVLKVLTERLAELIRRGVAERAFACESTEAAASALVATIQGYFVLAATARALIPKGSAAVATKQMAAGLLRPVETASPKRRRKS